MITVFTILGTRHYLLDYPNLHDTYNELRVEQEDLSRKINFKTEIHISMNKYMYYIVLL